MLFRIAKIFRENPRKISGKISWWQLGPVLAVLAVVLGWNASALYGMVKEARSRAFPTFDAPMSLYLPSPFENEMLRSDMAWPGIFNESFPPTPRSIGRLYSRSDQQLIPAAMLERFQRWTLWANSGHSTELAADVQSMVSSRGERWAKNNNCEWLRLETAFRAWQAGGSLDALLGLLKNCGHHTYALRVRAVHVLGMMEVSMDESLAAELSKVLQELMDIDSALPPPTERVTWERWSALLTIRALEQRQLAWLHQKKQKSD